MDREPDDEFDLQLDWANGPPPRPVASARLADPGVEVEQFTEPAPAQGADRMRLVLALGQSEVELRAAIDALDASRAFGSDMPGAMEEMREYIAAAFDAVRELTSQMVVLTDRLELTPGRPSTEDFIDIQSQLQAPTPPAGLAEEFVEEFTDRVERALDAFTSAVERLEGHQRDLQAEFQRLGDELANYRRRVQVHARPPIVTDEQLQTLIDGVATALGMPPPARATPSIPMSAPAEPPPPPPAEGPPPRSRRRKPPPEAAPEPPEAAPVAEEAGPAAAPDGTAARWPTRSDIEADLEPLRDPAEPEPPEPEPKMSRRQRRKAQRSSA